MPSSASLELYGHRSKLSKARSVLLPYVLDLSERWVCSPVNKRAGVQSPALLGSSSPIAVARAVIKVIHRDVPEKIVNPMPVRPF